MKYRSNTSILYLKCNNHNLVEYWNPPVTHNIFQQFHIAQMFMTKCLDNQGSFVPIKKLIFYFQLSEMCFIAS